MFPFCYLQAFFFFSSSFFFFLSTNFVVKYDVLCKKKNLFTITRCASLLQTDK